MPDELFANPRLAMLYDHLEGERDDLDHYVALVDEIGARSVLDVGCGTGTLACALADRGLDVVGLDPAEASLDLARSKPGAEQVRWLLGDVSDLPPLEVDVAVMTGNVAQVFVTDEAWMATLVGVRGALGETGRLVFETRDPADRAWERWNPEDSRHVVAVEGFGAVETWHEVTDVALPLVSFRTSFVVPGPETLTSESTLRFRSESEIRASLADSGFEVVDRRGAPDRPGREFVFIAACA